MVWVGGAEQLNRGRGGGRGVHTEINCGRGPNVFEAARRVRGPAPIPLR